MSKAFHQQQLAIMLSQVATALRASIADPNVHVTIVVRNDGGDDQMVVSSLVHPDKIDAHLRRALERLKQPTDYEAIAVSTVVDANEVDPKKH